MDNARKFAQILIIIIWFFCAFSCFVFIMIGVANVAKDHNGTTLLAALFSGFSLLISAAILHIILSVAISIFDIRDRVLGIELNEQVVETIRKTHPKARAVKPIKPMDSVEEEEMKRFNQGGI